LQAAGRWERLRPEHYVFVAHEGNATGLYRANPLRPVSYSATRSSLKKYGLLAGVTFKKVHLHALRHRGLHNRLEDQKRNGGTPDLLALRDVAGHKSVGTTEIYIHNTDQHVEDRWLAQAEAAHARELPEVAR
jgi:site-specific recombinase XerD